MPAKSPSGLTLRSTRTRQKAARPVSLVRWASLMPFSSMVARQLFPEHNGMRPTKFLAALVFSLFCSAALAGQTVYVAADCGQWLKDRNDFNKAALMGYLSGMNVMWAFYNKGRDPLQKVKSAQQAYVWMDNYCKSNPLSTIQVGANRLFDELSD